MRRAPGVAVEAVMLWMFIAAAALPKTPPPLSRRTLFALQRELVGAKGCPPRAPRLVGAREAVPVRALFREAPRGEERARSDCCDPHVRNQEVRADGLLLRVLKAVHIFWDAQVVGRQAEHIGQEGDNVGGLEAASAVLEAVEEVAEGGLVRKGQIFLEGEDPQLLDYGSDECAPSSFGAFEEPLKLDLGGPEALSLGADVVG